MTRQDRTPVAAADLFVGAGECGRLVAEHDWSATPLGPLESWRPTLRAAAALALRSPIPMVVLWGPEGVMIYNDAFAVVAGPRHPGLMGAEVRKGWPEAAEFNDRAMRTGLAGETLSFRDVELTPRRKGGPEQVFLDFDYSPIPDEDGRPAGVLAVVSETTEAVEARRARDAQAARLDGVLDGMDEAFGLMDRGFRILSLNAEARRSDPRPPEEIIGRTHWEAYPGSEDSELGRLYKRAMAERAPARLEHRHAWADGTARWLDMRAYPVPEGLAVFWRDITPRKEAEERLRASEARVREEAERVRLALDAGAIRGTWTMHVHEDRFVCDEPCAQAFGIEPEAARHGVSLSRVLAAIHPEDVAEVAAATREVVEAGGRSSRPYRVRGADGTYRLIEASGRAVPGPDGRTERLTGVVIDLEERRAAEAERDRAERLLSSVIEAMPGAVYAKDRDGRMILGNRGTTEAIGLPQDEYLGRRADEFLADPDQARAIMANDRRIMEAGTAERIEEVLTRPDGATAVFLSTKAPLRDSAGEVVGLVGASLDITERKAAEAALAESEAQLRFAFEAAGGVGTWDWDLRDNRVRVTGGFARLYGLDPAEAAAGLPPEALAARVLAEDRDLVEREIGGALALGGDFRTEYRIVTPEGVIRWLVARGRGLLGPDGAPVRSLGVAFDVTERHAAEEALRARTAELESILASAPLGVAFFDREHRWIAINEELAAINGFSVEAHLGRRLEDLLPVNAAHVGPVLDRVFATGEAARSVEVTGEVPGTPGVPRHWLVNYDPVRGPEGEVTAVGTWVVEITERKEAEARALEESRVLETLNRAGAALAGELDLDRLLQRLVDDAVELMAAAYGAFFHNVMDDTGERLHLYTLSGARRSDFEGMGGVRATGVFAPTFRNEGVVRADDILADARYGLFEPHKGMPRGHLPVRSYLAVPVVSRGGAVLGGLLFGHPEPGRFTDRHERLLTGLAAQAAVAIDNANLFAEVQRANATLEARVSEAVARRDEAEAALRQSQKMEAVGQLTGGIAHDFNNMLAAVVGSLDLLGRRIGEDDARSRRYVDAAMEGAKRAAILTQRLLAFARRQPLRPEALDVNRLVEGMSDLLRRALGSDIRLETALAPGLWTAHADPNQLESAILNLAVNARDAMPEGGWLTIETANLSPAETGAGHPGVPAGEHVVVTVTDTGTGMGPEVLSRAFDPFFTTKPVGRGTGLGLSQVYGFVRQSGGQVRIESEPGQGTAVRVYLPRLHGVEAEAPREEPARALPRGEARDVVLVVEDEAVVRQFTTAALEELGYRALQADGAEAALRLLDAHPDVALLFTDVVMPETNGRKLADEALRRRPGLRVLFTTGYARDAVAEGGVLPPGTQLIGKPFTVEALAAKLREVLDAPA